MVPIARVNIPKEIGDFRLIAPKPIFHCDANDLASGVGIGQCPRCQNFVLEIPTSWYILALLNAKKLRHPRRQTWNLRFSPTRNPNANQWNIGGVGSSGVGHVYFMYISCCLCIIFRVGYAKISRCKGSFQWNMGFTPLPGKLLDRFVHSQIMTHLDNNSLLNDFQNGFRKTSFNF